MRREDSENTAKKKARYCNKISNILDILYCVIIVILVVHLFVLQIFDVRKYRERGKMQRSSHDFAVRGEIDDRHEENLQQIEFIIIFMPVLLITLKRKLQER